MPRFPLPVIAESAEELLALRRAERDERRRERLHALWLLASGAASSRTALADQLGRNRETIRRWLGDYAQGGLATLLRAPQPPGPPSQGGIGLSA
jgi:transposase